MSKAHESGEKTKETHAGKDAHESHGKDAHTGEAKKPENKPAEHKKADAPVAKKGKGHEPLPGGCFSWGCKAHATRFNFCDEHYDHFKFGLVKKTGEPVSDYEKKFEHYTAYQARLKKSAKKAA